MNYYPPTCYTHGANSVVGKFLRGTSCRCIAEIGIYIGSTSQEIAKFLGGDGELHLFDFEDRVNPVASKLRKAGYKNIFPHPNSRRLLDSYNWSLMKQLQLRQKPVYDYVFLDGAHTWNVDALTFLLVDRLLTKGGYIHFDDYEWSLQNSKTLSPDVFPMTGKMYTQEQISTPQVRLIVDLLVRPDPRYREIVKNAIFQKVAD